MMLAMTTRCFTGKDAMERTEEEEEGEEKQQQKARLFGEVLVDKSFSNSSSSSPAAAAAAAPAAGAIVQTLVVAQTANDDGVVVHENSLDDDKEQKEMIMIQEGEKLKQEPANDVDESGVQAMHLEENVNAEGEEEEQQIAEEAEEAEEDVPQQKAPVAAATAATIKPEDKREQEEQDAAAETLLLPPQASGIEEQQQEGDEGKVVKKEEPYHHQNDDNNNNNNRKRALGLVQERQKKQCRRGGGGVGGGGGHAVEERKKDEEDVCYICFDGGDLVMCDRRSCPKAYHLNCIGRDAAFFRKKGAWICGWHFCSSCTKPGSFQCYMCPIAYCGGCVKEADFRMLRKRKGLCEECLPIVIMIECSQTVNSEGVEVDFEDKETYECLFKEYWLGLKNRLSLTLPELDKDGKLAKGICEDSENGGSDTENQDPSDVDGLGTESDRESDQDEDDSLDGKNQSRKKIKVAPTLSEDLVVENKADAFTEGAEDKEEEENEDEQEEEDEEDDDGDDDDAVSEVQSRKIEGWASKEVLDFIVHMKADPMKPLTRFAVNHLLWAYIKRHQLQDPEKKSQILCDERLQAMFGKKLMGQSEMYRQLNEHFPPKDSANGAKSLKELDRTVKDDARETDGTEDKLDRDMAKDRRRGRRRSDEKFERPDGNDFAAISPKNIGLIYLRRALLENLLDDPEFNSKVVDTFVKIRVPGSVSTLDTCYRLVLVTGTRQQTEFYKAGKKLTNVVLEILNLQKKEDLTIDLVSNQDFNEEECQRLRQSIKCGFIKTLTVGQLEAKAIALQEVKVNDWFESERQRLVNLRDRASEKGRKKELRECVEKLQELSNPTFRAAKLHARPEVSADPRMGPGYESDVSDEKPITDEFSSYRTKVSPGISWEKGSAVPSYNRLDSSNVEDSSFGGRKIDGDSHRYKPSSTRENNVGARDWSQKGYEAGRSSDRSFVRDINFMQEKSHWNEERGGGRSWTKDHRDYVQEQLSDQGGAEGSRATGKSRSDHWAGDSTGSKFVKDEFRTPLFDLPKVYPGGLQRESVGPAAAVLPLSNIGVTPLEPSVMKNQVALDMMEKEKVWHYQDPTGTVQGPFSMEQLRKWNTTGLFPIDLRIRRTGETHENSILLTSALAGKFTEERDPWTTTSTTTGFQSSTRDPVGGSSVSGLGEVKGSTWVGVRGTGDDRRWDTKRGEPDVPTHSTYSGTREWVEDHNAVEDRGSGWSRVRNSIYGSTPSASGRVDTRGPLRSRGDNDSWAPQLLAGGSRGQGLQDSGNGAGRSNWGRYSGRDSSNTGSWNDDSGSRDRSYLSERSSRLSKKDVPCKFHAQGYCKRGETCVFRHE